MAIIANNIRWFRKRQQISQTEFAQIFGITRASVGAYEEGRAEPKVDLLMRFAKHYQISLSEFIEKDHSISVAEQSIPNQNNDLVNKKDHGVFIPESLDNKLIEQFSGNSKRTMTRKVKSSEPKKQIPYYSNGINSDLEMENWPMFNGCNAVFECTPHIERTTNRFSDGQVFITVKVDQEGEYFGVFIKQDGKRFSIVENEITVTSDSNIWKIVYVLDSINTYL